jgi:heme/copper-type cytochrome/quinol oxidase subunit 2
MDTSLTPQDKTETQAEESVGCDWIFVAMLGISFGWLLNCGIIMSTIFFTVTRENEHPQPSEPLISTLTVAAVALVCLLIFATMSCWSQISLIPRHLPLSVYRRWKWSTLGGSVAYWAASWLFFYGMGWTNMLGLPELLGSVCEDPLAKALVYFAVGAVAGAAAMLPMTLPQWWSIRRYVPRAARWPAYMVLCNAVSVAFIYVCLLLAPSR